MTLNVLWLLISVYNVLAIPESIVGSKLAFSIGGHTLYTFRTCLSPKVIGFVNVFLYMLYKLIVYLTLANT